MQIIWLGEFTVFLSLVRGFNCELAISMNSLYFPFMYDVPMSLELDRLET